MKDKNLSDLVSEFLETVYGGTAHPHRRQVLDEFVEWEKERELFHAECSRKINEAFENIPGLERVA